MNQPKDKFSEPVMPSVTMDWHAYYKDFDQAHGGNPVRHGGRLLYHDGWTYSATDEQGPEWSPPADPILLRQLQVAYWTERGAIVKRELEALEQMAKGLEMLAKAKSMPLRYKIRTTDESGKGIVRDEVYQGEFRSHRIDFLRNDVRRCEDNVRRYSREEAPQETPQAPEGERLPGDHRPASLRRPDPGGVPM